MTRAPLRDPRHVRNAAVDDDTVPASQRLTFDVGAVASVAGLHDSRGNVPLDFCVPFRTTRPTPATISCDEIYILLYVDGATSLAQIAEETTLSLTETISIVLGLMAQGIVEVPDASPPPSRIARIAR